MVTPTTQPPTELQSVFDTWLPTKLGTRAWPVAMAQHTVLFVAQGEPPWAWRLAAPAPEAPYVLTLAPVETPASCTVVMQAHDFIALAQGLLNAQVAFMQGRLKVRGDLSVAMQLGGLFA